MGWASEFPRLKPGGLFDAMLTEGEHEAIKASPDRWGMVKVSTIRRDINALRDAIRSHDSFATEAAWEKVERWLEFIEERAALPPPAHEDTP